MIFLSNNTHYLLPKILKQFIIIIYEIISSRNKTFKNTYTFIYLYIYVFIFFIFTFFLNEQNILVTYSKAEYFS